MREGHLSNYRVYKGVEKLKKIFTVGESSPETGVMNFNIKTQGTGKKKYQK